MQVKPVYKTDVTAIQMRLNKRFEVPSSWHEAAFRGDLQRLQALFAQNHDINETSTSLDGRTALHLAVELGRADMIKFLVYNYADVNLATRAKLEVGQEFGNTALNMGVMGGKAEIVSLLISLSADPNGSCEGTNTPLNTAIQIWGVRYDQEIVHALCQAKADVKIPDRQGVLPLTRAILRIETQAVKHLLRARADAQERLPPSLDEEARFAD